MSLCASPAAAEEEGIAPTTLREIAGAGVLAGRPESRGIQGCRAKGTGVRVLVG